MAFRYRAYGLRIESARPIGLLSEDAFDAPDLHVDWRIGTADEVVPGADWERVRSADLDQRRVLAVFTAGHGNERLLMVRYSRGPGELHLLVNAAIDQVTIVHSAAVPLADCESYFVGPMLGAILRLRGVLVLHASVVEAGGSAIAFAGRKYSGKSTHAAALVRRGHRVLADDMAALSFGPHGVGVEAGYSRLRVRARTVELVTANGPADLPRVYSHGDSYYSPLGPDFHEKALPLVAVYLLTPDDGASEAVARVERLEAVALLGQNTVGNHVMTPRTRAAEFDMLCRLAAEVRVRTLRVRRGLGNLAGQCDAALQDLGMAGGES